MAYRVSGEQRGSLEGSDVRTALEDGDGMVVVGVDDTRAAESTEDLGSDESGHLLPRESSPGCESQGDCWVDVTS